MIKKIIDFASVNQFSNALKPAKSYIPEWYKKTEVVYGGGKELINLNSFGIGSKTIKACVPFLDAMLTGYTIELEQDIQVTTQKDGNQFIGWGEDEIQPVQIRALETLGKFPIGSEYTNQAWAWKSPYNIKTPSGYSILISHPINRLDLPFTTLSAVVDSDTVLNNGNIPFLIKKDFEGIIPAGTPIVQVFPFKRENWEAKENKTLLKEGSKMEFLYKTRQAFYKKNTWRKKKYD
jgi:hypothetical protein